MTSETLDRRLERIRSTRPDAGAMFRDSDAEGLDAAKSAAAWKLASGAGPHPAAIARVEADSSTSQIRAIPAVLSSGYGGKSVLRIPAGQAAPIAGRASRPPIAAPLWQHRGQATVIQYPHALGTRNIRLFLVIFHDKSKWFFVFPHSWDSPRCNWDDSSVNKPNP